MRSRSRWLKAVSDKEALTDVSGLVADINAAHGARNANATSETLIARLLLARYSADEIFDCAEAWAMSAEIREAIRYNGSVGVVDLADELNRRRDKQPRQQETPEQRAERFRRLDEQDAANVRMSAGAPA